MQGTMPDLVVVSLDSSNLWQFLVLVWLSMTLTPLKSTGPVFEKGPLVGVCLVPSHGLGGGYGCRGRSPRRPSALLIASGQRVHDITTVYDPQCQLWPDARFLHGEVTIFSFPYSLQTKWTISPVHLLEWGTSRNLWIYVKSTTVFNECFGGDTLKLWKYLASP